MQSSRHAWALPATDLRSRHGTCGSSVRKWHRHLCTGWFFLRPRRLLSLTFLIALTLILIPLLFSFLEAFALLSRDAPGITSETAGAELVSTRCTLFLASMRALALLGCPQKDDHLLNLTLRTCCLPSVVACAVACCAALFSFSVLALFQGVLTQTPVKLSLIRATVWSMHCTCSA